MKITMLGHSCLLIEIDGKRILTDPWLTNGAYFNILKHKGSFPENYEVLPLDLILVSHGHDDHFDPHTLKNLPKTIPVIIYSGYEKKALRAGFHKVIPVNNGVLTKISGIEILAMPGKHFGGLVTFMITGKQSKIFFGGDSVYFPELEFALKDTKPDVVLMPVSGGEIGFFKFHMNADEAAKLTIASKAKHAIPIHYHFETGSELINNLLMKENCVLDFQNYISKNSNETVVKILDYGQTFDLEEII